ncbi:MAG: histidine phosphatase family protein [Deltaproteobacteria bacterium]|nr:histidine phosphatase family protein [Deltaproteobacteria bacterium]
MSREVEPGRTYVSERERRASSRAQITLLRHAEPDWAPGGGAAVDDPGLTDYGHVQAERAAAALARERVDTIYVSPYRRSQETAQPLARALGLEPVTIPDFREVGVNVSGLASQEEVDAYFVDASQRPLAEHWDGWPGAERFEDFHTRATEALVEVLGRHSLRPAREHDFTVWEVPEPGPHIVVVAHGGTNAVLATHLLDIRPVPWEWMRFESQLAAYSVLQARSVGPSGNVWSLVNFNELDHLRPLP